MRGRPLERWERCGRCRCLASDLRQRGESGGSLDGVVAAAPLVRTDRSCLERGLLSRAWRERRCAGAVGHADGGDRHRPSSPRFAACAVGTGERRRGHSWQAPLLADSQGTHLATVGTARMPCSAALRQSQARKSRVEVAWAFDMRRDPECAGVGWASRGRWWRGCTVEA
jgi:hypothetical protein